MTQVNIGFQIGGEGFRQIIFFEDQRAFDEFTNGSFEFGADVILKGGAMAGVSVGGQKFQYTPTGKGG